MLALIEITIWHWLVFVAAVLLFLALDLGVFHRKAHVVRFREAMAWTVVWFAVAILFAIFFVRPQMGNNAFLKFITGYITELSLSMDNVFVIALVFAYFRVQSQHQHRVLFWGILGALIMRGLMIWLGVRVVEQFSWVLYALGGFLVYSGIKMICVEDGPPEPEKNPAIRLARRFYPITTDFVGDKFIVFREGKRMLTPLMLVLIMVETTDLVFAVDSIPAIFGVTTDPFIIFTSNVCAILGLRSLYFVLAGALDFFRYLKAGLSLVLIFIGIKMLIAPHADHIQNPLWFQREIPTSISLAVVLGIILASMLISILAGRREARLKKINKQEDGPPR